MRFQTKLALLTTAMSLSAAPALATQPDGVPPANQGTAHNPSHSNNGKTDNPAKACKGESKKHVEGQKGTPYSRCVSAAAKLQHDEEQGEDQQ